MLELSSEEDTLVLKANDTKINIEKLKTKSITAEKEEKKEIILSWLVCHLDGDFWSNFYKFDAEI